MFTIYQCINCDYIYEGYTGPQDPCQECTGMYFKQADVEVIKLEVGAGEIL